MLLPFLLATLQGASFLPRILSDQDLIHLQAAPYDKASLSGKRVLLGHHHGALVVADFPCSDLCPAYTTRIIHYDVTPLSAACAAVDGVVRVAIVPKGVAAHRETFCVPRVLGDALIPLGA